MLWCYLRNPAFKTAEMDYHLSADLTGQANHLGVTIEADIIKQKLPENNGGYNALKFGKTDKRVYSDLTPGDHPIELTRYQVANCYLGRVPLINSGGASGDNDFGDAARTAVINKRAGGMGLITGRKAFQRPMDEGVKLLQSHPGCISRQIYHYRLMHMLARFGRGAIINNKGYVDRQLNRWLGIAGPTNSSSRRSPRVILRNRPNAAHLSHPRCLRPLGLTFATSFATLFETLCDPKSFKPHHAALCYCSSLPPSPRPRHRQRSPCLPPHPPWAGTAGTPFAWTSPPTSSLPRQRPWPKTG